jgi:hypothetical protein
VTDKAPGMLGRFIDRRGHMQCAATGVVFLWIFAWLIVSTAIGQSIPDKADAPVRTSDLVRFQWWAIAALLGAVNALVMFIFVSLFNSTKASIRELFRDKLGRTEHDKLDHTPLCAVCRDAHLSIGDSRRGG